MAIQLLFILFLSFFGYFLLIQYARQLKLMDVPISRSSHIKEIPKGFGIIIFLSSILSTLAFKPVFLYANIYCFIAIFLILALGVLDDIKNYKPIIKVLIPILAYLFLYIDGLQIEGLGVYLGHNIELNNVWSIIFTLFALIAYTNAFNLIDGIDGLSGSLGIIILSTFAYIGYSNHDEFLIILPIIFITSLFVFMLFNWNPAKVFLGNSGSLMIGFLITLLGIKSLDYIQPIAILYIAALPIFDSIIVFFRRIQKQQHPFKPDKKHLHHIILSYMRQDINKTIFIMASIQIFFSILGITIISTVSDSFFPLLIIIILLFLVYFYTLNYQEDNIDN